MRSIVELRPAAEAMAAELSGLLWDRRVHERVAGIVRSNPSLMSKAQAGNPYLNGVRRWWGIASALVLRRHVDPGTQGSLRWIVERLVEFDDDQTGSSPSSASSEHKADLEQLDQVSLRFRAYLNATIHGGGVPDSAHVTFNDLHQAIDAIAEIGQRTYSAVTNISRRFEPIEQFEWTDIFEMPWISDGAKNQAYVLGEDGVPYDALPMTVAESKTIARINLRLDPGSGNEVIVTAKNDGSAEALDVRVFLPYLRTVIDVAAMAPDASVEERIGWMETDDPKFGWGQAVIEFSDVYDHVYRQYADVNFITGRVRRLSKVPFLVQGRIVSSRSYAFQ